MSKEPRGIADWQEQTLDYYQRNAQEYAQATLRANITEVRHMFMRRLPRRAHVLDAGCGAGRDTLAFLRQGYKVSAFDASSVLCQIYSELTGVPARELRFQDFDTTEEYNGIWACASLLHLPRSLLPNSLFRLVHGLKRGGILYMSFKHGDGERFAPDGRFFTDLRVQDLDSLISETPDVSVDKIWTSTGTDGYDRPTLWTNALVTKIGGELEV